ncbi:hypothetical protein BJX68DRAFT_238325 [Aspergillus pseudodeflectus]|uniref:Secreted protein n=1 Tax=Aspergillus pseudodeflectus TaxID=176178 RepID=A0ABR4K8K2_9EURO
MQLNHCWPVIFIILLLCSSTCVTNWITSSYVQPHRKPRLMTLSRSWNLEIWQDRHLRYFCTLYITISEDLLPNLSSMRICKAT